LGVTLTIRARALPAFAWMCLLLAACAASPPRAPRVSPQPSIAAPAAPLPAAPAELSSATQPAAPAAPLPQPSVAGTSEPSAASGAAPGAGAETAPEYVATANDPINAAPLVPATPGAPSALSADAPGGGPTAAMPAAVSPAAGPTQVAGLTPAQYADLFDRMRSGFKLEDALDRHAIDQQLQWYASNPDYLQRAFGRADLYLYYIVTELERRGMPLEISLLPVVESAFEPYAYSRARASGLWQFIPDTGSKYALKQDWWYDGRRDIVESTRAALDYLQSLHDQFNGDWLLAIAAYNCGEALVERAVEMNRSTGRPVSFWDLWLPRETRAYVPKLLAMRRLVLDPETYGLAISPIPNQPYFVREPTNGQINLKLAAEIAGISPEELYELNPGFHRWATDPGGPHYLLLPVNAADVFAENITQLTADQRLGVDRYTVRRGDSIASLARHFHTTVNVIRELNDMPTGAPSVGDDLRVPSAVTELPQKVMLAAARVDGRRGRSLRPHVQIVRRGESLWTIARRHGINVNTLAMMNGLHPGDPLRAGQRIRLSSGSGGGAHTARRRLVYTVRDGDTVPAIAKLFQCSVPQLLAWNGLSTHSHLHAGQKLRIHLVSHHG
jgi:membrane-bound lytic murein transglycosylase D